MLVQIYKNIEKIQSRRLKSINFNLKTFLILLIFDEIQNIESHLKQQLMNLLTLSSMFILDPQYQSLQQILLLCIC